MVIFDWLFLALRAVLAGIFITYGLSKMQDFKAFAQVIRRYKVLPIGADAVLARIIPPLELSLGVLLLFNILPLVITIALSVLLIIFSGVLVKSLFTKTIDKTACGCGSSQLKSAKAALLRNVTLLLLAGAIIVVSVNSVQASFGSLFVGLEALILIVLVLRTLQPSWLTGLGFRLQSVQSKMLSTGNTTSTVNEASLRSRRSFVRAGVGFGLAALSVVVFGAGNTVLADVPICRCNYSRICRLLVVNPNCSCCNSCTTGSCTGTASVYLLLR